jgi:hypothetical protein
MQIHSLSSGLSTILPTTTQVNAKGLTLAGIEKNGPSVNTSSTTTSKDTSETFAAEILRRLQSATTASNAAATTENGTADELQAALAETIDYVRENHGDAAATAVMGIIIKGVGDGSGGEDALGNALVSSLKFIDNNFGIASGDAAIAQFNGSLNNAVNSYYQNGHNETFYASDGTTDTTSQIQGILSSTLADVTKNFGEDVAKTVSDIIKGSLEKTGVNRQGLGKALTAADAYLTENFGASDLTSQAGIQTSLDKGAVVDLAV